MQLLWPGLFLVVRDPSFFASEHVDLAVHDVDRGDKGEQVCEGDEGCWAAQAEIQA